jgi:exonuclease III
MPESRMALRVVSWNLNMRKADGAMRQAAYLRELDPQPDLLLLQEVNPGSIHTLSTMAGMTWLECWTDYYMRSEYDENRWIYGVAIAGRGSISQNCDLLQESLFPEKALVTTISIHGSQFTAASYHAPPGSNPKVKDKKAAQAVAFARFLEGVQGPVLFGADLNTPRVDAVDFSAVKTWWDTGMPKLHGEWGEDKLAGPRKIHDLEDALRKWLCDNPGERSRLARERPGGPLAHSLRIKVSGKYARYDAIWVSRHFEVANISYPFQETRELSDHSPVIADLLLTATENPTPSPHDKANPDRSLDSRATSDSSPYAIAARPAGQVARPVRSAAAWEGTEPTRASQAKRAPADWNGADYYVLLDDDIPRWQDAREWRYVYADGGARWTTPLFRLQPGARVFVHLRHHGYVAVGRVLDAPVTVGEFTVQDGKRQRALLDVLLHDESIKQHPDDPGSAMYVVRVRWEWAVPASQGLWETGFFSVRHKVTLTEMRDTETSSRICAYAGIPTTNTP